MLFESSGMYRGEDLVALASHLAVGRLDAVWGSRRLSVRDIHESYRLRYQQQRRSLGAISYVGSHVLSLAYLLLYGRYISDTLSAVRAVRAADALALGVRSQPQAGQPAPARRAAAARGGDPRVAGPVLSAFHRSGSSARSAFDGLQRPGRRVIARRLAPTRRRPPRTARLRGGHTGAAGRHTHETGDPDHSRGRPRLPPGRATPKPLVPVDGRPMLDHLLTLCTVRWIASWWSCIPPFATAFGARDRLRDTGVG